MQTRYIHCLVGSACEPLMRRFNEHGEMLPNAIAADKSPYPRLILGHPDSQLVQSLMAMMIPFPPSNPWKREAAQKSGGRIIKFLALLSI